MSEEAELLLTALIQELGSPGIVVDPDVAVNTPCRCYFFEGSPKICYSKGIIGSLSEGQKDAYCKRIENLGESKRAKKFMEAAEEAGKEVEGLPEGERLEPWLHAIGRAVKKRGIEL